MQNETSSAFHSAAAGSAVLCSRACLSDLLLWHSISCHTPGLGRSSIRSSITAHRADRHQRMQCRVRMDNVPVKHSRFSTIVITECLHSPNVHPSPEITAVPPHMQSKIPHPASKGHLEKSSPAFACIWRKIISGTPSLLVSQILENVATRCIQVSSRPSAGSRARQTGRRYICLLCRCSPGVGGICQHVLR